MIDERKAKGVLNYIQKANLSTVYNIIPFEDADNIDPTILEELINEYQEIDAIIDAIKGEYCDYSTHIYKTVKNIPSALRKIGHILDTDTLNQTFFCGREKEINKINIIRHKRIKNNVLIIGEPGIGKTSLVEAYAKQFSIKNIFIVECAKLISNTEYRGAFEQRVVELMDFAKGMDLVLFFDEIHTLLDLGKTTGGISITDILKPYLLDQKTCFIGATTVKEAQLLLADEAFKRRFTSIILEEPSDEILLDIKNNFENQVIREQLLSDQDAKKVIELIRENVRRQYFLDKLVDFLDYMYAFKCVKGYTVEYNVLLEEYIHDQNFALSNKKC